MRQQKRNLFPLEFVENNTEKWVLLRLRKLNFYIHVNLEINISLKRYTYNSTASNNERLGSFF